MPSYHDIRGDVEPFDIFLFGGKGFISRAIQQITGSRWSHVAIGLRLQEFDWNLIYESTTLSDLPDLTTGAKVKGVQLHHLSQRIAKYDGIVGWRRISGRKSDEMIQKAAEFVREFQGVPYEENQLELLASAIDKIDLIRHDDASSVFCSEIAAMILRRVGVLQSDNLPANEFTPADFAKPLALNDGYDAGQIVIIKDA